MYYYIIHSDVCNQVFRCDALLSNQIQSAAGNEDIYTLSDPWLGENWYGDTTS